MLFCISPPVPAATKASPCKAEGEVANEEGDREEGKNTTEEASTSLNDQGEEKVLTPPLSIQSFIYTQCYEDNE